MSMSMGEPQVIAVVGVGDLGKFVCEELLKDSRYHVVVLSRRAHEWAEQRGIRSYTCPGYSEDLVLQALNASKAVALISFVNAMEDYFKIHLSLANACVRSDSCKRFIPSEWSGNLDDFPSLPRSFGMTRNGFKQHLRQMEGLESTLVCPGWLMDYLVMPNQTYMTPIGDWHTIDLSTWEVCIRGTGDEQQSLTAARDVGRAICSLLAAPSWEPVTYLSSEWMTYHDLVCLVEEFHGRISNHSSLDTALTGDLGKKFTRKLPKSKNAIYEALEAQAQSTDQSEWIKASLDEWMITGAAACPKEKTLRQRGEYFPDISFTSVKKFLQQAAEGGLA